MLPSLHNVTNVQETVLCESSCSTENVDEKSHNECPNNQSYTEKSGGHYASFVAMFCSLHIDTRVKETNIFFPITLQSYYEPCPLIIENLLVCFI